MNLNPGPQKLSGCFKTNYVIDPFKEFHFLVDQVFKYMSLWGPFLLKLPQVSCTDSGILKLKYLLK